MSPRLATLASRRSLASAGVLALALALSFAPGAAANAPAPFVRTSGNLGGAFVVAPTSLVVEHEELSFRCDSPKACSFRAVYHVTNPGDAREEVLGAFYGISAHEVTARADGVDARHELTSKELAICDASVAAIEPAVLTYGVLRRTGFTLGVAAHARAELVFEGDIEPVYEEDGRDRAEYAIDAVGTRHPWLSTEPRSDARVEFAYALSPIRSWGGSPTIDVSVRFAGSLRWAAEGGPWSLSQEGGADMARASIAAKDASVLRLGFMVPGTTVQNGGPLIAAGGRIGPAELRTRLGYEVSYPSGVIYSGAVETSFHGRTSLVPLAEIATPDIFFFIPSLGLGVGVPVQLRSGEPTLVGGRAQITLSFPVLSFVVPIDVFPGGTGSERTQVAFLGQASF